MGVAPVENSSEGGVSVTLDQFMNVDLQVRGEVFWPVRHMLMAAGGVLEDVKKVFSHPQALNQCRDWLQRNLLQAVLLVETSSTAAAALHAGVTSGSVAVGSELTAQHYELEILARDIQDNPHNMTCFFILSN